MDAPRGRPAPLGALVLVLHAHVPFVLGHGRWPHGESWLFEAASASWLPLLGVLDRLAADRIVPAWTIGLTPAVLEQVAAPRFRAGFRRWLADRVRRARADARTFADDARGPLAERWARHYTDQQQQFRALGADLTRGFRRHARAGAIELLTSNATHGYSALLLDDRSLRAQIRAGVRTSAAHGIRARGAWWPECAYRPDGPWRPIAVHGDERDRDGTGAAWAAEGIRYAFVDADTLRRGVPAAARAANGGRFRPISAQYPASRVAPDLPAAAWGSVHVPHRVAERGRVLPLTVFARCPEVSEQVWSARHGYPGDPRYLEFHKREGLDGLRYWRVTGADVDLGGKQPYDPDQAALAVADQADHFVRVVRGRLMQHRATTGAAGVVCAPFDAELFGHWWHEGPAFLEAVARRLHDHPEVVAQTAGQHLRDAPARLAIRLAEGSWGAGGDHRVWLDERVRYVWEVQYHAEDRLLRAIDRVPWREDPDLRERITGACRELLLLQASDWPFVVSTRGAVDYGHRRIADHAARFESILNTVDDRVAGRAPDPADEAAWTHARAVDTVFPELDPEDWA